MNLAALRATSPRELARRASIAGATLLALFAVLYVSFQSAQARIPQHRAALENLVRAQTGLDLRFNGLTLQWGWGGPEVAFSRIELDAPAKAGFALHAAQLIVAFDAWRSIQTGHVELGSIRLIAPDIELSSGSGASHRTGSAGDAPGPARALDVLRRWTGGRIELEGGTVRIASLDAQPMSLQIRSAMFVRAGRRWTGQTDILLPARLGRTLRLSMDLTGDTPDAPDISGLVRFDGLSLVIPAWRSILDPALAYPGALPVAGVGSLRGLVHLRSGRIVDGEGTLAGRELAFQELTVGTLRTRWALTRNRSEWRVGLTELHVGPEPAAASRATFTLDEVSHRAHGSLDSLGAAQALRLLQLESGQSEDRGRLSATVFDWDAQEPGARSLTLTSHWHLPALDGAVRVEARLSWRQVGNAWDMRAERVTFDRDDVRLELSGTLAAWKMGQPRPYALEGLLLHTDPALLRELMGRQADLWTAPLGGANRGDEIARAEFALTGDAGRHDSPIGWRAALTNARVGAVEIESLNAEGVREPESSALAPGALRLRARGELAVLRGWMSAQSAQLPVAESLSQLPPVSGNAILDFDLHGAANRGPRLRATLDGGRLALGSQFPAVESLSGSVQLDDGHFRRSTLTGAWLGGILRLRLASRGAQVLAQLDGELDAAQAAGALGLDANLLKGRTIWHGDWQWDPARDGAVGVWRGSAQSQLFGVASGLPEPFDKVAGNALPVRLDVEGGPRGGTLRVAASGRLQAVLALTPGSQDTWRVQRAGVSIGEGVAALPGDAVVAFDGAVTAADLETLLGGWRELIDASDAPPLQGGITVGSLSAAGYRFPNVRVDAHQTNDGLRLVLAFADIEGSVQLPAVRDDRTPALVRLSRLALAETEGAPGFARVRTLLGRSAQLSVDRLSAGDRDLGRLTAVLDNDGDVLGIDRLELTGPLYDARGELRCSDAGVCGGDLALQTSDVAATLAAFGYRDDVSAGRGRLDASVSWNVRDPRDTLDGHASLALTDGVVRSAGSDRAPFALFVVPTLLASTAAETMGFRSLEGDFELREGSAYTSNLHLDGEAEVFVRGRTGLVARDYDHNAWVLRGSDRLPVAIRRLGAAPAVASLWLGLRDFLTADYSRKVLHVGGSWDAPLVTGETGVRGQAFPPPIEGAP